MALNSSDFQGGQAEISQIYRGVSEVATAKKHAKKPRPGKKAANNAKDAVAKDEEGVEETDSERMGEDRGTAMSGRGHMNV